MPIQLDFFLRRLVEMAENDPALRDRQPWKAAHERDYGWLARVLEDHYAGDDTEPARAGRRPAGGVRRTSPSTSSTRRPPPSCAAPVTPRWAAATSSAPTPRWSSCSAISGRNGFANYIASGGGRDFMRPDQRRGVRHPPRGRDRQRRRAGVHARRGRGGTITRQGAPDYLDDGPEKPVHIWTRTGRRPVLAAGNSNGDIEMLDFTQHPDRPSLRLLLLHDDAEREFDYVSGAERALDRAAHRGLDGRQHQGRLGHGVLTPGGLLSPPTPGSRPSSRRRAPRAATAARPCSSPAGR